MSCATLNMDPGVQTFQNTTTTNQTTLLEKEHNHPNNYKKKQSDSPPTIAPVVTVTKPESLTDNDDGYGVQQEQTLFLC